MSLSATRWAWQVPRLKSAERLVLLCYADHANTQANAWPTIARIATATGLSRRTVFRAIEALVAARLSAPIGRGGRSGYQSVFRVCGRAHGAGELEVWRWESDPVAGRWVRQKGCHGGTPLDPEVCHTGQKGCHGGTKGVPRWHPNPKEPTKETAPAALDSPTFDARSVFDQLKRGLANVVRETK